MRFFKPKYFILLLVAAITIISGFDLYSVSILVVFTYCFVGFVADLGKKILILEVIVLIALLQWVVMPVVAYYYFNSENGLAILWDTIMPIGPTEYFSYAAPATFAFIIGMKLPLIKQREILATDFIGNIKVFLKDKAALGIVFLVLGVLFTLLVKIMPESVRNIGQNFAFLTYIGMFYIYFSKFKSRLLVIGICYAIMFLQIIASGMFTEFVRVSVFFIIIALIGKNIKIYHKVVFLTIATFVILLVQSMKLEYREATWDVDGTQRGDATAFNKILGDRLRNPLLIFDENAMFGMATRTNQGLVNARVIAYVPKYADFAYGETIAKSIVSSFVPRFLWKEKPRVGGAENVCRFLGDCNKLDGLSYTSYNISSMGEAYANFGRIGGVIFMLFYGMLFNFLYNKALLVAIKIPTLILWFPVLFIGGLIQEGDILEFINTFTKSTFFTWLIYFAATKIFRLKI